MGLDAKDPIAVSYGNPIGNEPTGRAHPELLKMHPSHGHDQTIVNGISRIGYMSGGRSARWVDEDMADVITARARAFLERHREEPFFLYFATHDIHVPRVPHARFAGRSGLGPRGDVILQLDWAIGEILDALDRLGLADRTLVLFTQRQRAGRGRRLPRRGGREAGRPPPRGAAPRGQVQRVRRRERGCPSSCAGRGT